MDFEIIVAKKKVDENLKVNLYQIISQLLVATKTMALIKNDWNTGITSAYVKT